MQRTEYKIYLQLIFVRNELWHSFFFLSSSQTVTDVKIVCKCKYPIEEDPSFSWPPISVWREFIRTHLTFGPTLHSLFDHRGTLHILRWGVDHLLKGHSPDESLFFLSTQNNVKQFSQVGAVEMSTLWQCKG